MVVEPILKIIFIALVILLFFIDIKPTEKPNWKEFKKEKQELRVKRKQQKCPFYETVQKAKQLWENVRRDDCPKEKKETLLNELIKFSKPHLETVIILEYYFKYDLCM